MASAGANALDVMLMLDSSKLDELRLYFMENEDKLPLMEFVTGVLRYFPADKVGLSQVGRAPAPNSYHSHCHNCTTQIGADPVETVRGLCELFAQVDVNGDGTMEVCALRTVCGRSPVSTRMCSMLVSGLVCVRPCSGKSSRVFASKQACPPTVLYHSRSGGLWSMFTLQNEHRITCGFLGLYTCRLCKRWSAKRLWWFSAVLTPTPYVLCRDPQFACEDDTHCVRVYDVECDTLAQGFPLLHVMK